MSAANPQLSLVIPAFNEARRLPPSLDDAMRFLEARAEPFEVILVDDGSTDGTLELIHDWSARHPAIRVVHYQPNRGKGRALAEGVAASRGARVLISDADFSTPITDLDRLEAAFGPEPGRVQVAIGSRARPGAHIEVAQPLYRVLGGRAVNLVIQALLLPGLWDTQCGFKLFEGEAARRAFAQLSCEGFAWDVDVLWSIRRGGGRVVEVPVTWRHKEDSRVAPFRHALEIIGDVIRLRLRG